MDHPVHLGGEAFVLTELKVTPLVEKKVPGRFVRSAFKQWPAWHRSLLVSGRAGQVPGACMRACAPLTSSPRCVPAFVLAGGRCAAACKLLSPCRRGTRKKNGGEAHPVTAHAPGFAYAHQTPCVQLPAGAARRRRRRRRQRPSQVRRLLLLSEGRDRSLLGCGPLGAAVPRSSGSLIPVGRGPCGGCSRLLAASCESAPAKGSPEFSHLHFTIHRSCVFRTPCAEDLVRWVRLDPAGEQLIDIKLLQVREGFAVCSIRWVHCMFSLMGLLRVFLERLAATACSSTAERRPEAPSCSLCCYTACPTAPRPTTNSCPLPRSNLPHSNLPAAGAAAGGAAAALSRRGGAGGGDSGAPWGFAASGLRRSPQGTARKLGRLVAPPRIGQGGELCTLGYPWLPQQPPFFACCLPPYHAAAG